MTVKADIHCVRGGLLSCGEAPARHRRPDDDAAETARAGQGGKSCPPLSANRRLPSFKISANPGKLPFRPASLSHLVLFDVFHHLRSPNAFLLEARRVLSPAGRLILFEPYISWTSYPIYGLLHHEPVALREPINRAGSLPRPRDYYAAQGNATRLFFRQEIAG